METMETREVLFENRYERTADLAKELYRYYFFKRPRFVVLDIFLALGLLANILVGIFEKSFQYEILIVLLVYYLFRFYMYRKTVNALLKRDHETYAGKPAGVHMLVMAETMQCTTSSGAVTEIAYSKFKNAIQTKNLISLRSEANLLYIFRKDSFTKGTPEAFISFLQAKGIKVK